MARNWRMAVKRSVHRTMCTPSLFKQTSPSCLVPILSLSFWHGSWARFFRNAFLLAFWSIFGQSKSVGIAPLLAILAKFWPQGVLCNFARLPEHRCHLAWTPSCRWRRCNGESLHCLAIVAVQSFQLGYKLMTFVLYLCHRGNFSIVWTE